MKLNIGCGRKLKKGYINIDVCRSKRCKPDVVADCRHLPYESNSVDVIESYHLIEHLSKDEAIEALKHWFDVLKPNGKLIMELPDLLECVKLLIRGDKEMIHSIYGRQRNEYDYHKYGYTKSMLKELLQSMNYSQVIFEEPTDYHAELEPCMRVIATK